MFSFSVRMRSYDCANLLLLLLGQSLGAEKDNLDIVQHDWALPKFEQRAEAVLKKLVKN